MKRLLISFASLCALAFGQSAPPRTEFKVKYVAEGSVYLDGGRNAGLGEGMKLTVTRASGATPDALTQTIAELQISAVADASAVCEFLSTQAAVEPGDIARLSQEDAQIIQAVKASNEGRRYAQVVTFTEGDPLDEEQRVSLPHPPLAEINRARGRVGFEYNTIRQGQSAGISSQFGLAIRTDMTRIGGTHWNLSGYWRGRMNSRTSSLQQETINDLMSRTYHLTLAYSNPQSLWMAGFGRLYLPWASSLQTIDGGYVARRLNRKFTASTFAGSTPDPTSWNYNPNRQLAGALLNYTSGSFESLRFSTTGGLALSQVHWKPERRFAFFENSLFYKQYLSIYHDLEADEFRRQPNATDNGLRVSRSFLTLRLQPARIFSVDFSHNYFRNVPTFDPRLIGTGLLDKLLFQGASVGFRLELPWRSAVYSSFGRSSRTGDAKRSLNQMYGFSLADLFRGGIRADVRYTKYDSSFGSGAYRALSLSRQVSDRLRLEILAGDQSLHSAFSAQGPARFVTGSADWSLGRHYFSGGGYTLYRSHSQNYNQAYVNLGYRF